MPELTHHQSPPVTLHLVIEGGNLAEAEPTTHRTDFDGDPALPTVEVSVTVPDFGGGDWTADEVTAHVAELLRRARAEGIEPGHPAHEALVDALVWGAHMASDD